ncbi:MAG TPA: helix-turn-helix domain-containing protein [Candidatus Bathyarchaeia archaeon]|nr:helix-turn-helix domain-containing protein [Candidatus Bathyarchaeia archaeon]
MSEEVTKQLSDFGLSDKEANIYLALLRSGKARAGEIARKLQLNRMIVYRVLTKLQERELVKATMEKPMKFIPIPLEKALDLLIRETETKLSLMRDRHGAVLDEWKSVLTEPSVSDAMSFRIVQGRKQIYELLAKMFKSADNYIRLVTTKKDLVRFQYVDLDDALKRAAKRGVKVQIVIQYEDDKLDILPRYAAFASIKIVPISKASRLFISDDKEMIITFTTDDSMALNSKQETCLKIESREGKSLNTVVDIFANFWESADELDLPETISKAGEDLKILRTESVFTHFLETVIGSAETELLIGIPKNSTPSIKEKIMTEVAKRANQLPVRMILFADSNDLNRVDLLRKIDAYHSELLQNMQFIIKDRKEILVSLQMNASDENARMKHVWSNSRLYVESMAELVAGFWSKSQPIDSRITELKRIQMAPRCIAELRDYLERGNWKVTVPGVISPTPEIKFDFSLLAEDKKGRKLVAEFINGGYNNFEVITSFYARAMNAGADSLNLVAVPVLSPEETSFAEYCSMKVIQANDPSELSSTLNQPPVAHHTGSS